jgi:photosystem II PsbW protein
MNTLDAASLKVSDVSIYGDVKRDLRNLQTILVHTSLKLTMATMLASKCSSSGVARAPKLNRSLRRVVRAQASKNTSAVQKLVATAVALPALLASSPALAVVDDRLYGDGVGLPFGVNEPVLGWAMFGVFSLVWIVWYNSQKDFGDFDDEDSGLKL